MKTILYAALVSIALATPVSAAKLYLKDGGFIQALRIWRSDSKVHVLVTRHTQTSFEMSEVDLKRTFGKRHKTMKKQRRNDRQAATTPPQGTATAQQPPANKAGISLPSLPKLPERKPESLVPSSGNGGTIRQHKKEMSERAAE